ncbi:MAG: hypothetical protein ACXADA_05580 [Candidatus Hodarchaeales archaeon]|jgi:hypothetical protein
MRATQYPDNSMIPLVDLLIRDSYHRLRNFTRGMREDPDIYYRDMIYFRIYFIERVLELLQKKKLLPTRYLPSLNCFEKNSGLAEALKEFEEAQEKLLRMSKSKKIR